jgi:hypothetical protein
MPPSSEPGQVDTPATAGVLRPRSAPLRESDLEAIAQYSPLSLAEVREAAASLQQRPRFSVITDAATSDDRLGFRPLVRTLARIVLSEDTETPLAIAVDGPWGSGKTSILKMVEKQARLGGFSAIWINAWALERAEFLIAEITAGIQDELKRSGRTEYGRAEKLAVFLGRAFASLVPDRLGGQVVRDLVHANVTTAETRGETTEIASLVRTQKAFRELVNILLERDPGQASKRRLLVLIDDLDRALPDQIAAMLKNLKQLMDEAEGCIFLLAMDVMLVAGGIEDFYRGRYGTGSNISLRAAEGSTQLEVIPERGSIIPGFGANYLEKLFQITLSVPQLSRLVVLDCVRSFGFADDVVEIIAWAPGAEILNPRRLKRYLNSLSIRQQLILDSALPQEFDGIYALRALALRRDYRAIYERLALPQTDVVSLLWPEGAANDGETQGKFRTYLAKLRAETGALGRFDAFLARANLYSTIVAKDASPDQDAGQTRVLWTSPPTEPVKREPEPLNPAEGSASGFTGYHQALRQAVEQAYRLRSEATKADGAEREAAFRRAAVAFRAVVEELPQATTAEERQMRDILREELAFCDMFTGAKELIAEAEKIYGELKEEWPDRASIWLRLGQLRRDAGDFEKAWEFMERGLAVAEARPDPDPNVQRQVNWVLRRDLAVATWRLVDLDPDRRDAASLLERAVALSEAALPYAKTEYQYLNTRLNLLYFMVDLWKRSHGEGRKKLAARGAELLAELRPKMNLDVWSLEWIDSLARGELAFGERARAEAAARTINKRIGARLAELPNANASHAAAFQVLARDDQDMYLTAQAMLSGGDA